MVLLHESSCSSEVLEADEAVDDEEELEEGSSKVTSIGISCAFACKTDVFFAVG
jgi:hypothetical protein